MRLQKERPVGSIGVSNFNRDHLERIIAETGVAPAVDQVDFTRALSRGRCARFTTGSGSKRDPEPARARRFAWRGRDRRHRREHRKTPAQVVIRWHLDSGLIAIPKTVRAGRLKENIGALDFRLDDDDTRRIEALDSPNGQSVRTRQRRPFNCSRRKRSRPACRRSPSQPADSHHQRGGAFDASEGADFSIRNTISRSPRSTP